MSNQGLEETVMLKNFAYAALVAAAACAFTLGSATTGEAKAKKKMAAPPPQPMVCLYEAPGAVCGSLKGHRFTYANACSAYKDGATIVSKGACKAKKAHKAKKAKKAMKKPAKKAAKKKM
jgi:hypothetical protein